jgi:hypothetical protein
MERKKEFIYENFKSITDEKDHLNILRIVMLDEQEYNQENGLDLKFVVDDKVGKSSYINLNLLESINPYYIDKLYNIIHSLIYNERS